MDKATTWHTLSVKATATELVADLEHGLSNAEAQRRLAERGPNELAERPRPGIWRLLYEQFNNFLVIILIAAAVISFALGEIKEAAAILTIVILNAILGMVQERRAEEALAALQKMAAPEARVLRDGHRVTVPARELVPGDLVFLEAGNYVPADLRLVEQALARQGQAAPHD